MLKWLSERSEGSRRKKDDHEKDNVFIIGGADDPALEVEFDRFNEYYPNVELKYTKVDDYNNMIGTVLNGNDAPDIYVNYSWMYGRDQYRDSISHAENLADPELGLDLDCVRGNITLKTDDAIIQLRQAAYCVGTGKMTVNEAIAAFGTFEQ